MQALTPTPINILDINNPVKLFASANDIVPTNAIIKKQPITFFGPILSNKSPIGICIIEKPIKQPPANNPRFPAVRSNSQVRTGVKVAVIDLTRLDSRNPKAKTQNMIMLLTLSLVTLAILSIQIWL